MACVRSGGFQPESEAGEAGHLPEVKAGEHLG